MRIRHSVTQHFSLEEANFKLQKENVALRRKIATNFISIQPGVYKMDDSLRQRQYLYIPATVINATCDKENNYLTINAGSLRGIKEGMGVINEDGVAGIVFHVSKHFALVKTLLTEKINLDILLPNGAFGLIKWDGRDPRLAQITGIANDIKIKKGDLVASRGSNARFPKGYPVGRIATFYKENGSPLWQINVRLSVDFRKVTHVYVIQNLLKKEQESIEKFAQ